MEICQPPPNFWGFSVLFNVSASVNHQLVITYEGYLNSENSNSDSQKSAKMLKINVFHDFKFKIPFAKLRKGPLLEKSLEKSYFFGQNVQLATGICTKTGQRHWFTSGICTKRIKNKHQIPKFDTFFPRVFIFSKMKSPNPNIFSQGFRTDISRRNSSVFKNLIHKFPKSSIFDVSATKSVHKNVHFHRFWTLSIFSRR